MPTPPTLSRPRLARLLARLLAAALALFASGPTPAGLAAETPADARTVAGLATEGEVATGEGLATVRGATAPDRAGLTSNTSVTGCPAATGDASAVTGTPVIGSAPAQGGSARPARPVVETVALVSDLEGSRARWEWFLTHHPAFVAGPDGRHHLRPTAGLVFAGDVPDRFPGERHLLRELLRLWGEAPDRVVLLAGNRDVNKLRLPLELSPAALARPPRERAAEFAAWCETTKRRDAAATRLRWILEKTMGAPAAFELRRRELGQELDRDPAGIADEAVVASYLADASPGGLFHLYLQAASLMVRWGPTLFVHAGLPQAALGLVPGRRRRAADPEAWAAGLDGWYRGELATWEAGLAGWDGVTARPGAALIAYAEKWGQGSSNPFSVLYGRTPDRAGRIDLPPPAVVAWLRQAGVRRLVVGHTPSGQLPLLRRSPDGGFEQLLLDTSYGRPGDLPLVSLREGGEATEVSALVDREMVRSAPCPEAAGEDPVGTASDAADAALGIAGPPARWPAVGERAGSGLGPDPADGVRVTFVARLGQGGPLGQRLPDGSVVVAPFAEGWLAHHLGPGHAIHYQRTPEAPQARPVPSQPAHPSEPGGATRHP